MPSVTIDRREEQGAAGRLWYAAICVLALTPAVLVVWRQFPPVSAGLVVLLMVLASWQAGQGQALLRATVTSLRSPGLVLALMALAYITLSLAWTPGPERALTRVIDVALTGLVILVMIAAVRLGAPANLSSIFPVALGLAAVLLLVNAHFDSVLNDVLGRGNRPSHLNRSAVAIVLFLPLCLTILYLAQRWLALIALATIAAVAVLGTESWAARLSLVAIALLAPLAWRWPLLTHRVVLGGIVTGILLMPAIAFHANDLLPAWTHQKMGYASLTIRAEAWHEYAAMIPFRPLLGFGVEASHNVATWITTDVIREAHPTLHTHGTSFDAQQIMLMSFYHPHNMPLQIWFELGVVGIGLTLLLVYVVFRRLERMPRTYLPAATLTALGIFLIASVGFGAWVAWWLSLWGLVTVAFQLSLRQPMRPVHTTSDQQTPAQANPSTAK
ncbi:MAG: O-antigen ligase family protein [Geminicoccaceae bacterium]|nr:MAG: O-antigen ligase family protein [Geminicoccaceae bacterium]